MELSRSGPGLRRVAAIVAALNLGYFGVEFSVALAIGSVSLFADSVDFLEDASVNLLILVALGWTAAPRAKVGMVMAGILLIPGIATLWTAWEKFNVPAPPAPLALSLTGAGALAVNLFCAILLSRHRHQGGSLTRAAFLSSRNDAFANVAIIVAGLITAFIWQSAWPDLLVGLGIAALNLDAARKVWTAARAERGALNGCSTSQSSGPSKSSVDSTGAVASSCDGRGRASQSASISPAVERLGGEAQVGPVQPQRLHRPPRCPVCRPESKAKAGRRGGRSPGDAPERVGGGSGFPQPSEGTRMIGAEGEDVVGHRHQGVEIKRAARLWPTRSSASRCRRPTASRN